MNIMHKITVRNLLKNKVRTIVTIIGIVLSVALFTAVTESLASGQKFLIRTVIEDVGSWQGTLRGIDGEKLESLRQDEQIKSLVAAENVGFGLYGGAGTDDRPYVFVQGMEEGFADMVSVHLTAGRMPQNSSEILVPSIYSELGGVRPEIGQQITFNLGDRVLGQEKLNAYSSYVERERLVDRQEHTYTIVGFYEPFSYEVMSYSCPGELFLTCKSESETADSYTVFFEMKHPRNIYEFIGQQGMEEPVLTDTNSDLLMYMGVSDNDAFVYLFTSFGAVLIFIIMFGSISLIYNAFSISVSERTRQFGMLKSIGATRKQLTRSVFYEAMILCLISIPIGLSIGCLGIGITMHCLSDPITSIFGEIGGVEGTSVRFALSLNIWALLIAAAVGFLTVLISAYIPAKRAMRVSPIDAIRQSKDLLVKPGQVKTSKLTYKLFGFEGMLAKKNFKRNRKRYRSTVFSLFFSVVLFISASSFCSYLTESIDILDDGRSYDISYYSYFTGEDTIDQQNREQIYDIFLRTESIKNAAYCIMGYNVKAWVPTSILSKEYRERELSAEDAKEEYLQINCDIAFVNDSAYEKYLKENRYDVEQYMNPDEPVALVYDQIQGYTFDEDHYRSYYTIHVFENKPDLFNCQFYDVKQIEGYEYKWSTEYENGKVRYTYENETGEKLTLSEEEAMTLKNITLGERIKGEEPYFVNVRNDFTLLFPESAIKTLGINRGLLQNLRYYAVSNNHRESYNILEEDLIANGFNIDALTDYAESDDMERGAIEVLNVFSYGFIILISLIALANVFNTISTNVALRRRELAMLKSVGMRGREFHKMMNYECLLYGIKGLAWGLPVSIAVTYGIYQLIKDTVSVRFYIPWYSLVIAIGSVFVVVFITMLYSMRKIKKDNVIDALRNENL